MSIFFSLLILSFVLSACGDGTHYKNNSQEFFSSSNPFAPILSLKGDNPQYVEVNTAYQEPGFEASSLKDGDLSSSVFKTSDVDMSQLGDYFINYSVKSSDGFAVVQQRKVIVEDTTAPSIALVGAGELTIERAIGFQDPGVDAQDNYDQSPKIDVEGSVNPNVVGDYQLQYFAVDTSGNQSSVVKRIVHVKDTTPPRNINVSSLGPSPTNDISDRQVLISGDLDVVKYQALVLQAQTCDLVNFANASEFDIQNTSTFVATMTANSWNIVCARGRDAYGNYQTLISSSNPVYIDTQLPSVTITSPAEGFFVTSDNMNSIAVSGTCSENDQKVEVENGTDMQQDICHANQWQVHLSFTGFSDGPVQVTADHSDDVGNHAPQAIVHGIKDTQAPVITLNHPEWNPYHKNLCEAYDDPGATAVDNIDGNVEVQTQEDVNPLVSDTYTVHYTAEDRAGNHSEETRDVRYRLKLNGTDFDRGIDSTTGLDAVRNDLSLNYVLCQDLDFIMDPLGHDFAPIGDAFNPFTGVFHGQNYTINNLQIVDDSRDHIALFGMTDTTGLIRNLKLKTVVLEGQAQVGALVGENMGLVKEVSVQDGTVQAIGDGASHRDVGGLVGRNEGKLNEASAVNLDVTGDQYVGGLVGRNNTYVQNSYSQVNVQAESDSSLYIGGLIGKMGLSDDLIGVTDSYSASTVTATDPGGLIGYTTKGFVVSSYWDTDISGVPDQMLNPDRYGSPRTTLEMQTQDNYSDWDFDLIWAILTDQYPHHLWAE